MNFFEVKLWLSGLIGLLLANFALAQSGETDSRLHADGPQGWGVREAKVQDPNLPRVLLIGDSILNGYLATVVHELDGKANVDAWVNPYHQASEGLHEKLAVILAGQKYAVIHFNMGLHGWPKGRIPDGQFIPLTRKLVETLRAGAPKARLIWASSTPVTAKGQPAVLDPAINPIIVNHNSMAAQVMRAANVPINDLYSLMANRLDLARGDQFHWKPEGSVLQGKAVAASIAGQLKDLVTAADTRPRSQVIPLRPGSEVSHEMAAPEGRFRNIDVPTLTAFLPDKNASAEFKGTAVIVCPGGGYSVCDTADTLQRLKVPVELHLFETGGHGNFTPDGQPPGGQWPTLLLDWFRKVMSDKQNLFHEKEASASSH